MMDLCLSTYIQIMQNGLRNHDKQESAAGFLLDSINTQKYVGEHGLYTSNLGSTKISRIVSRKDPVPDAIVAASNIPEVINGVLDYFKKEVVPDLKPHTSDDTLATMAKVIRDDESISEKKKDSLLDLYRKDEVAEFLAETFLYAVNKPNKSHKGEEEVLADDAPLLAEANYECPIKHIELVGDIKGKPVKKYSITKIFPDGLTPEQETSFAAIYPKPDDLDSEKNLIALSREASEEYLLNPTIEEYKELHDIKEKLARNYAARIAVNKIDLENDIRSVIGALSSLASTNDIEVLSYDALKLEEKFTKENFILKNETKNMVVQYYKYIETLFSDSNVDFDMIASEILLGSQKLERSGLSQEEVVYQLADWIRNKSGMGKSSRLACNIVVAFFIQNCEVFHK